MTFGLNLGEVEAFTFPGEDDVGRATTFSNSYASEHKDNSGYGGQDDHAFPDDVITRRRGQVKSTIKRAIRRLSSVTEYPRGRTHLDPQLTLLVHIR